MSPRMFHGTLAATMDLAARSRELLDGKTDFALPAELLEVNHQGLRHKLADRARAPFLDIGRRYKLK